MDQVRGVGGLGKDPKSYIENRLWLMELHSEKALRTACLLMHIPDHPAAAALPKTSRHG